MFAEYAKKEVRRDVEPLNWMSSIIIRIYLGIVFKEDVNCTWHTVINKLRCQQSKRLNSKTLALEQRQYLPIAKMYLTLRDNQKKVYIGPCLFSPNLVSDRPKAAL